MLVLPRTLRWWSAMLLTAALQLMSSAAAAQSLPTQPRTPESRAESQPQAGVPPQLLATLRRPGGMLYCGSYEVEIWTDGVVWFRGDHRRPDGCVRTGTHRGLVAAAQIERLVELATLAGYFELPAEFAQPTAHDCGVVKTSLHLAGRSHSVFRDYGDPRAPEALGEFERYLDSIAAARFTGGSQSWIRRHLGNDDAWSQADFGSRCDHDDPPGCVDDGFQAEGSPAAIAAVSLLRPFGEFLPSDRARDSKTNRIGLLRLVDAQVAPGVFDTAHDQHAVLTQAWATMVLSTPPWTDRVAVKDRPALESAALARLCQMQMTDGAWRESDDEQAVVVTGWALLALANAEERAAEAAARAARAAMPWLEHHLATLRDGSRKEAPTPADGAAATRRLVASTAVAIIARRMAGKTGADAALPQEVEFLGATPPICDLEGNPDDPDAALFGLVALMGLDARVAWLSRFVHPSVEMRVTERGCRAGSWAPRGLTGRVAGRLGCTVIRELCLALVYRYPRPAFHLR